MPAIQDIFRTYAPEYRQRHHDRIPGNHRKLIDAIINCRTASFGTHMFRCQDCGKPHVAFASCGNRHCPTCQGHSAHQWLDSQLERALPGHHFLLTFTVPQQVRRFIRANQRHAYNAMFAASSAAINKLVRDPRHVGADMSGFTGVLHTWGRQLQYHPHIHYIVPGGAYGTHDRLWHPSRIDFFLPVRALSRIYRAKFRDRIQRLGLLDQIDPEVWTKPWNVNCQAVGDASASLRYLAPYVFRVAISDSRIVHWGQGTVTFRWKRPRSERWRNTTVPAMEFIRRFLQHVLPDGLQKVRHYGLMHPNCSVPLDRVRALIELAYGFDVPPGEPQPQPQWVMNCPHCGGRLEHVLFAPPVRSG